MGCCLGPDERKYMKDGNEDTKILPLLVRRQQNKQRAPIGRNRSQGLEEISAEISDPVKPSSEISLIFKVLSTHNLFNTLTKAEIESITNAMKKYIFAADTTVCEQGNPGSYFYIISYGKLEVRVNGKSRAILERGHSFGELALMHDTTRTATIAPLEQVVLWGLDRTSFREALEFINENKYNENKAFIDSIHLFDRLTDEQKESLLSVIVFNEFKEKQVIVREGDPGHSFYIIRSGVVVCSIQGRIVREMEKGEFFGEQALIYNTERTATVTAKSTVEVLSLGKEDLASVLGDHFERIIYKNSIRMALEQYPKAAHLTKIQLDRVIDLLNIKTYQPGESVVNAQANKLCCLLKGRLIGNERTIDVFSCIDSNENEFFAEEVSDVAEVSFQALEESLGAPLDVLCERNQIIQLLKSVHLLRSLPSNTLQKIGQKLTIEEYPQDTEICAENEPGSSFYIVKEGQVDIIKNFVVIRKIGKNDYFGERSILLNENRTATVIASTNVKLWTLNKKDFQRMLNDNILRQLHRRIELQNDSIGLNELSKVALLGNGMFGNVYLTIHPNTRVLYALKTVDRSKIIGYNIFENVLLEKKVMMRLDHPFVVKLVKTFKDDKRLYFLMEFVKGMDLFDVLRKLNLLNSNQAQFYTGCLLLIIEHLHEQRIIYRDFKPENIMIDEEGYPKLIDFGTAKEVLGRTYTVVGTPHYMAPEVISGKGYGLAADFHSIGVMLYEFVCGHMPFGDEEEDPMKIYQKILQHKIIFPDFVQQDHSLKSAINIMLSRNPPSRGSSQTIMCHQWFRGMDWELLLTRGYPSPFKPKTWKIDKDIEKAKKCGNLVDFENVAKVRSKNIEPFGWDHDF